MGFGTDIMEQKLAKPEWLKIKLSLNDNFSNIKQTLKQNNLHTVCEEAHCPNISECWNGGTATFMLMGDICTRGCKFCAVKTGNPMKKLDAEEPKKLAQALAEIKLFDYVVLTSVNRDDLEDGGASHFAEFVDYISYLRLLFLEKWSNIISCQRACNTDNNAPEYRACAFFQIVS